MIQSLKWRMAQRLEIRWWKRYLNGRDVDAYGKWKRNYWNVFLEPLKAHLDLGKGSRVLDAGCGPSGIYMVLNEDRVTAIDPLISKYDGLDHFDRNNFPNVDFQESTIEGFFTNRPFDTIFCLNAINHVSGIDAALDNLFAHLAPGGRLVLSIDCHKYNALKHLFRWIPGDALHPHQHNAADYHRMVKARGGKVLKDLLSKRGNIFDYRVLVISRETQVKT